MTEFVIPPWIIPDEEDIELIDDNTIGFEPALGRGSSQRQSFGAPRYKITRKHTVRNSEEAVLAATLSACSGKFMAVRSTIKKTLRGSFVTSELIPNNQFADGTSGWTAGNGSIHRVADRVSTLMIGNAQTGVSAVIYGIVRSVTTVQYAPYAIRGSFAGARNIPDAFVLAGSAPGSGDYFSGSGAVPTLVIGAGAANSTTTHCTFGAQTISGSVYENYHTCNYTSLSRCAVVDNGGNLLLQSDNFALSWTLNAVTINADIIASPIIGTTADGITETTANAGHFVTQATTTSAVASDIALTVYVKAGIRNFVFLQMDDATNGARVSFNLTTGAVVTTTLFGTATNVRSFSQSVGNGWLLLSIVVRKTTATNWVSSILSSTDGVVFVFVGSTAGPAFYAIRATEALSSFPTRPTFTTTTTVAATGQSGSALLIKGLPASTNGLALPGDFIEYNGELKRLTAALDSDGLGLGYLQFKPEIIRAPVDNDAVIFFQPMGRFLVSNVRTRQRVSDVELSYELEQIYE